MDNRMMACRAQMLLCLVALAVLPPDRLLPLVTAQDVPEDPTDVPVTELPPAPKDDSALADPGITGAEKEGDGGVTTAPDCREEQFPCTRLYSVHKPVKQCISYLCVTSLRRTYMINKEICSRIVCKEDEAMQEEICRQLAGLPPRRLRRHSGQPRGPLCRRRQAQQDQQLNSVDAQ